MGRLTGFPQDEFITLCFVRFSGIDVTLGAAYQYNIAGTQSQSDPEQRNKQCSMYVFHRKQTQRLTTMTPEDRNEMIELVTRIARETDPKKLAVWIDDLNGLIQSKIRELRESRKSA